MKENNYQLVKELSECIRSFIKPVKTNEQLNIEAVELLRKYNLLNNWKNFMKNIDESVKEFNDELNAILDKLPKSGKHTQTFTSIVDILKVVAEKNETDYSLWRWER